MAATSLRPTSSTSCSTDRSLRTGNCCSTCAAACLPSLISSCTLYLFFGATIRVCPTDTTGRTATVQTRATAINELFKALIIGFSPSIDNNNFLIRLRQNFLTPQGG